MDKFEIKSAEELAKMGAEELAAYFNAKNAHERDTLTEKFEGDVSKLREYVEKELLGQMEALNEKLKAQGLAIVQGMQGASHKSDNTPKSVARQIRDGLIANREKLTAQKGASEGDARANSFTLDVKVPGTMLFSSNVSGGNIPVEDRLEGLNIVPSRVVRLLEILSQRNTSANVVSWVYQANKDGTTGQTAEGAVKNQIDFDLVVANEAVKKTTAYIKVSEEMLDDIEWLESEINAELLRELLKAVEAGVYNGDGTGNNYNGIRTVASAFAAGSFAASVDNANIVDVLTVALDQIRIAQEGGAEPTAILMNPSDVTALKLIKVSTTDRRYVDRLVQVGSEMSLDGIPIIATTLITQDEYLIGDFSKAVLVTRDGVRIEMGMDADDFTKNLRTIRAEWRGLVLVKNNDRSAFVQGDFSTDAAALETP